MKSHRYRARDVDMVFRRVAIALIMAAVGMLAYEIDAEYSEAFGFGKGVAPTQVIPH